MRNAKDSLRISKLHATLIARTYLDGDTLRQVTAELMSESSASKYRSHAKTLIASYLGRSDRK
jgi:hypothetical protein